MCGIAGFVGVGSAADLKAMTDALAHRGPDGEGFFHDEAARVFLGMRRLAVIDIATGVQPMSDAEGTVCVIYNGEIYNHRELRAELQAKGHRFRTHHSDTEVLVHGYKAWGSDLPRRLNGMFAFAIYDRRQQRLFLARDRFGEKPLFWRQGSNGFAFASELPALARHAGLPPLDLDPVGLRKFFAYALFPGSSSPYRGVEKLPAGHSLTLDLASRRVQRERYWIFRLEPATGPVTAARERAWVEELRHLLSQAVQRRLESDVPLGLFLSGGMDSSALLAFAARHRAAAEIETFTIGFNEPTFDEAPYAASVASAIGSRHRAEICDLDSAQRHLPQLLGDLGEPVGDSSVLPTYLLSRFSRRHVTVALSGDGGDELFAGYDPFKALALARRYQSLMPRSLHPAMRWLVGLLPLGDGNLSWDFKLRRALRGLEQRPALWLPLWMGALDPREIAELFGVAVDPEELFAEAIAAWDENPELGLVDRTLTFFTRIYLPEGILTKTDRSSSLVSLEARAPFLDNDLVDLARRLPHQMKFRDGRTKYILRRALRGIVPDATIDRPKKGFGIPLSRWLRELPQPLPDPRLPLDRGWLQRKWAAHAGGREDVRHGLWCWLSLQQAHDAVTRVSPPGRAAEVDPATEASAPNRRRTDHAGIAEEPTPRRAEPPHLQVRRLQADTGEQRAAAGETAWYGSDFER
jgi:asparagine synthase (glutamine-hydrolysing)